MQSSVDSGLSVILSGLDNLFFCTADFLEVGSKWLLYVFVFSWNSWCLWSQIWRHRVQSHTEVPHAAICQSWISSGYVLVWQRVSFVQLCNAYGLVTGRFVLATRFDFVRIIDTADSGSGECLDMHAIIVYRAMWMFHLRSGVDNELSMVPTEWWTMIVRFLWEL